jgi:hypothetical protein
MTCSYVHILNVVSKYNSIPNDFDYDMHTHEVKNTTLSEQFENTTLSEQFENTTLSEQFEKL